MRNDVVMLRRNMQGRGRGPSGLKEADLHIHTDVSDGVLTPEEVVGHAIRLGLSAIAIADHDAVNGIPVAMQAADGTGLGIVPAVELTGEVDGREMHLLGYHIDWANVRFRQRLAEFQKLRYERAKQILERLDGLGLHIPLERVMSRAAGASVGRLHIARGMEERGLVPNTRDAFRYYIGDGLPACVPKTRLNPHDAIELVLDAGGIPVLAHPGTLEQDEVIPKLVDAGIRGMEVYHFDHAPRTVDRYERIAEEHGLIATGGSDCHGNLRGDLMMGRIRVPYSFVRRLSEIHREDLSRWEGAGQKAGTKCTPGGTCGD